VCRWHKSSRGLFVSTSQVNGRVWLLRKILHNKLMAACMPVGATALAEYNEFKYPCLTDAS
jgi:hypothetical protein